MATAGLDPDAGRGIMAAEQEAEETVSQELHSASELRIVLFGGRWTGKSEAGNTILNREEFRSGSSSSAGTKECEKGTGEVSGRRVTVVDTPDLLHTDRVEIERCVSLSAPGPHTFLLVIRVYSKGREHRQWWKSVVKGHCKAFDQVQELFGERAVRNTMILFTYGDRLKGRTIEQHIEEAGEELQQLVEKCGNRYHVLNNENRSDRTQVTQLLDKIDNMVKRSGGCYLPISSEIYQQVEERIRLKEQELNEKHKEELSRKEEEMKQKYEEEQRRREEEMKEKLRKQMKEEELEKEAEESKLPVRRRNSIGDYPPNMSGGEGEAPLADNQAPPSPWERKERAGEVRIRKKRDEQIDRVGYEKSKLLKERPGELELQLELRRERERSRVLERELKRAQEGEQELKKERKKRRELEEELELMREKFRVLERELKRAQEGEQEVKRGRKEESYRRSRSGGERGLEREREKRRELELQLELMRERERSRVLERELKRAQEVEQELRREREKRELERELKRAQEGEQEVRKEREKRRELERELKRAQEGEQEVKKERKKMTELEEELERRREREKSSVLEQELKRVEEAEKEMKKEREKRELEERARGEQRRER